MRVDRCRFGCWFLGRNGAFVAFGLLLLRWRLLGSHGGLRGLFARNPGLDVSFVVGRGQGAYAAGSGQFEIEIRGYEGLGVLDHDSL